MLLEDIPRFAPGNSASAHLCDHGERMIGTYFAASKSLIRLRETVGNLVLPNQWAIQRQCLRI